MSDLFVPSSSSPIDMSHPINETPEPAVNAKWQHGSFEIIASDNIKFCIEPYHLQSWRLV
jgi:hypothetical protein